MLSSFYPWIQTSLLLQTYRVKNTHKSRNDSSGSLGPQPEPYLRPDPSAQRNSRASDTSSAYSGSDNFGGDDGQFSDDDMDASSLEVGVLTVRLQVVVRM